MHTAHLRAGAHAVAACSAMAAPACTSSGESARPFACDEHAEVLSPTSGGRPGSLHAWQRSVIIRSRIQWHWSAWAGGVRRVGLRTGLVEFT